MSKNNTLVSMYNKGEDGQPRAIIGGYSVFWGVLGVDKEVIQEFGLDANLPNDLMATAYIYAWANRHSNLSLVKVSAHICGPESLCLIWTENATGDEVLLEDGFKHYS